MTAVRDTYRFVGDALPPAEAFDAYHAIMAPGAEAVRAATPFRAALAGLRLPQLALHHRAVQGVVHRRDAGCVRRSDFDHATITLCLAGEVLVRSGEARVRVRPGEMVLLDMRHPGELVLGDVRVLTVAVARDVLAAAVGEPARVHARHVDAGAAGPLRRYLRDLMAFPCADDPDDRGAAMSVADHLGQLVLPVADADAPRARARLALRRLIEARLDDPDFDVAALVRASGVSRAGLYRLFEPVGGIARYLLDLRLARLRQWLADPGERAPFAALVERAGLASESHASRAFLQLFGERPGAWRKQAGVMAEAEIAANAMRTWQALLR